MNKTIKKTVIGVLSLTMMLSTAVPAFAASTYVNSTSSVVGDLTAATPEGQDQTQGKQTEYYAEFTADATAVPCDVYATQASGSDIYDPSNPNADGDGMVDGSIGVIIPKTIILDGAEGFGDYTVRAKGNIAGDEKISVVPESTFALKQVGKDDVTAKVTQNIKGFALLTSTVSDPTFLKTLTLEYNNAASTTGQIDAEGLSAGSWHGTFNFTITIGK